MCLWNWNSNVKSANNHQSCSAWMDSNISFCVAAPCSGILFPSPCEVWLPFRDSGEDVRQKCSGRPLDGRNSNAINSCGKIPLYSKVYNTTLCWLFYCILLFMWRILLLCVLRVYICRHNTHTADKEFSCAEFDTFLHRRGKKQNDHILSLSICCFAQTTVLVWIKTWILQLI